MTSLSSPNEGEIMSGAREKPRTTMFNANKLKLGIFSPNCSGGMAVTKVPERWDASWENNLKLAQMADEAGIEFLLPIARWKGYGGETDFEGSTLETITWACGLLAKTKRITVFGTVHAPLVHPIFAAKQMVTVSHVSEGRFGLNIVCGWNQDEFEMFGIAQREHDTRYEYGQEWWDVVQKIWQENAPFDYDGRFIKLKGVIGKPKPYKWRPVVMNAGSSGVGRAFGAKNCDFLFTVLIDKEKGKQDVQRTKEIAAETGGDLLSPLHVLLTLYEIDQHGEQKIAVLCAEGAAHSAGAGIHDHRPPFVWLRLSYHALQLDKAAVV